MKFWWVNHNKTGTEEVEGNFLWSPKTNSHGGKNQTYENMQLANAGEPVLSYRGAALRSVGVVVGRAFDAPKPKEFGAVVEDWAPHGWRLPVAFAESSKGDCAPRPPRSTSSASADKVFADHLADGSRRTGIPVRDKRGPLSDRYGIAGGGLAS